MSLWFLILLAETPVLTGLQYVIKDVVGNFGGLTEAEIAELLTVSEETVRRDWRLAKAWLRRELDTGTP